MKKIVYVSTEERINGDSFDLYFTLDKEEAIEWSKAHREKYLTANERKKTISCVYGYEVEVAEGQPINEAYHELILNSLCVEPVDYIKIEEE